MEKPTTNNQYDLAIIGGGLAGLCLAIQSGEAGMKTVLFEKERYPFHRVCGEYISLESQGFLSGLGLRFDGLPIIERLLVTDVYGHSFPFRLPLGGFGISRYALDAFLYEKALLAGVDVRCGEKVGQAFFENGNFNIRTGAANHTAKVAVGAFGKRSNLDIAWKRPFATQQNGRAKAKGQNYIGVKYHINYDIERDQIALYNFSNGYCGISAIEDGKCCLCYLTTAQNLESNGNSIERMEKEVLSTNPFLKKIFAEATFLYPRPLVISQVSFLEKSPVENHFLMCGDAAGVIPPLCGNGMSMAMHTSKIAFGLIGQYLSNKISQKEMENQFTVQWDKQFKTRLWSGRCVQKIFGNNLATSLFLYALSPFPNTSRLVIGLTHGKPF